MSSAAASQKFPYSHFAPIDCDLHPSVPNMTVLLPYFDEPWQEAIKLRGVPDLNLSSYPPSAPLSCRPDWRIGSSKGASNLEQLKAQALDPFGTRFGICNCLYGGQVIPDGYLGAAVCKAVNSWIAREWLDEDSRLRASIVVPIQNPGLAVEEIERCANDLRFVQVLMLAMAEMPLGRSYYWPIYEAAVRHNLPIGIHAGSMFRQPLSGVGWHSYLAEDYTSNALAFGAQLASLVSEGVFKKFPDLTVVLIESGISWLPSMMWRFDKLWRGIRAEVPWVDRPPSEIICERVRLTSQPFDVPPNSPMLTKTLEHFDAENMILFSTDYPHWQFEGNAAMPEGIPDKMLEKIFVENARQTYPRMRA